MNAYDSQIGCVPLQEQDENVDKPLGYRSKIRNDREKNLDTAHREYRVVLLTILLPSPYQKGTEFRLKPTIMSASGFST